MARGVRKSTQQPRNTQGLRAGNTNRGARGRDRSRERRRRDQGDSSQSSSAAPNSSTTSTNTPNFSISTASRRFSTLGATPLHLATRAGNLEQMGHLLDMGVDTEQRDAAGATALHWAVLFEQREAVMLLLEAGADVNAPILSATQRHRQAPAEEESEAFRDAGAAEPETSTGEAADSEAA